MAVKIRLLRVGKRKQPTYRVVVADARSPRDGRIIQAIGQYRPREEPSFVQIDADAALAWLRKGARPSDEVQKLLATQGIWQTFESERGAPVNTKAVRRQREMARAGIEPRKSKKAQAAAVATEPVPSAPAETEEKTEGTDASERAETPEAADVRDPEATTDDPETAEDA